MMKKFIISFAALLMTCVCVSGQETIDLSSADIVIIENDRVVGKAAEALSIEFAQRSGQVLPVRSSSETTCVLMGTEKALIAHEPSLKSCLDGIPPTGPEGYKIVCTGSGIVIAGHDSRGVMYGAGRLILMSDYKGGGISVKKIEPISSTPCQVIRGHDVLPSPKAKDQTEEWAVENFEDYIRELALFGMNGLENLRRNPNIYSEIAKEYGMDIWLTEYFNDEGAETPEGKRRMIESRDRLYRSKTHIDHLSIKSGDPGELPLDEFFEVSRECAARLRKYHPDAKVWLLPQRVVEAPEEYFLEFCERANQADWIDGVGFGPWSRLTLAQLRSRIRPDLPIRIFPDIGHNYACQYPLRALDLPMAMTLGRISINPSPRAQKYIFDFNAEHTVGSVAYSEGTNDDLNKFLWLIWGWNPEVTPEDAVAAYARFFLGEEWVKDFTEGIFALEQNLVGELETNVSVENTLHHWQQMEARADKETINNVRFLMPLLRAYYDAYTRRRYISELEIEDKAYEILGQAGKKGSSWTINKARKILLEASEPADGQMRAKVHELYRSVYEDKGRWTMEYQHCILWDHIDQTLADSEWMLYTLDRIEELPTNQERLDAIRARLTHRTDPGEGGFYYNLGDDSTEDITKINSSWYDDPLHLVTPHCGFGAKMRRFVINHGGFSGHPVPRAWLEQVGVYYDRPLELTFEGFEPGQSYLARIVYVGESQKWKTDVSLKAEGQQIHGPIKLFEDTVVEYDIPVQVTSDGRATLTWQAGSGERGCWVAEIMFIKK